LLSSRARLDIRASFVGVRLSISVYGLHFLIAQRLNAGPFRVGPVLTGRRRALLRLRLYYEPVRLPHLYGPALPRQLVGACKRYGSPRFRCNPLDDPLRPATPARRCRLAFQRLLRYWLRQSRDTLPISPQRDTEDFSMSCAC
jgi:hypothetical protein